MFIKRFPKGRKTFEVWRFFGGTPQVYELEETGVLTFVEENRYAADPQFETEWEPPKKG